MKQLTRLSCLGLLAVVAVVTSIAPVQGQAQRSDKNVALAYEGWSQNQDGSYDLWFGYFNRSWSQEYDVPIGPDNNIEPGGLDRGQPAHFFPRRNQYVFSVRVPADFGDSEVVWTLKTDGVTEKAYATLHHLYLVDDGVMTANLGGCGAFGFCPEAVGNKAPELRIENERVLRTRVAEPVALSAVATDDGKLANRPMSVFLVGRDQFLPNSAGGLRFSWYHYRGPGQVTFDPTQTDVWEDRRDGGNSPWSAGYANPPIPPDNRWTAQARFSEPGAYVIRALAHDGGLFNYEDVTVIVE